MKTKIIQNFSVKTKDLGEGVIEAIVASSKTDRHGEVLDMKGLDIANFKKNPVVLWAHRYDEPPVARATKIRKTDDGKLVATMKFAVAEYSKARDIYQLIKNEFLNAFSIGFIVHEMEGNTFTKSEMLEFSVVPVPANAEALALVRKLGIDTNLLKNYNNNNDGRGLCKKMKTKKVLKKEVLKKEVKKASLKKVKNLEAQIKELNQAVEKLEKVEVKNINTFNTQKDAVSMEEKLKFYVKGLATGNFADYTNVVGKDAMNTTDDSALLPPEEFLAEVQRLEEQFGVAVRNAEVRRTDKPTLRGIKGADDVEFIETDEGEVKQSVKPSYTPFELTFKKYAAIVPVTDELIEDSAVNIWNDLTGRFARAGAKKEDQIVLSHATSGILNTAGVATQIVTGDSIEDVTFDDINQMIYKVPTPSAQNGKFYLHRTILGVIQRLKDDNDNYIWKPGVNGIADGTIWGYPYELSEVMPNLTQDAENKAFLFFGDLKNSLLGIRVPMQLKYFDSGVIIDPDDDQDTLNLMTQDIQAVRARLRMNVVHKFATAYCVLKTGTSAS